jgi:hypothetical protein
MKIIFLEARLLARMERLIQKWSIHITHIRFFCDPASFTGLDVHVADISILLQTDYKSSTYPPKQQLREVNGISCGIVYVKPGHTINEISNEPNSGFRSDQHTQCISGMLLTLYTARKKQRKRKIGRKRKRNNEQNALGCLLRIDNYLFLLLWYDSSTRQI